MFLEEQQIESPAHLRRSHCFDYVTWRQKPDKASGKYRARLNTALLELKTLRIILQEAVERGLITGNPCVKLGIRRERVAQKPELTAEDCEAIRAGIQKVVDPVQKEFLFNSFEIARYQGCRLTETRLNPQTDVDLGERTITFRIKGGREHKTILHPNLVPLFERLQKEGRTSTWEGPSGYRQWGSITWHRFLKRNGLKARGITFHSTRVTVVTELARANVHEAKAQGYVGHASTTVHRIYQRLRPGDLSDCTKVVG
jgi:site-specific recombinase XerD